MSEATAGPAAATTRDPEQAGPAAGEQWDTRGLRRVVLGSLVAVLGPLFGFLAGSMVGMSPDGKGADPMFLWMFAGLAIGAAGAFLAFFGGLVFVGANRRRL
ncbi:MAG: hypothetical protein ACOYBY_03640 [Dermatophilaceae bacterium]